YAVEAWRAGKPLRRSREQAAQRLMELLEPGFAQADEGTAPPRLVSEMTAGSFFELVRLYASSGRTEQLEEAVPVITTVALAPFVGREEAQRIARGRRGDSGPRSG